VLKIQRSFLRSCIMFFGDLTFHQTDHQVPRVPPVEKLRLRSSGNKLLATPYVPFGGELAILLGLRQKQQHKSCNSDTHCDYVTRHVKTCSLNFSFRMLSRLWMLDSVSTKYHDMVKSYRIRKVH
jgi:hypothetical protein